MKDKLDITIKEENIIKINKLKYKSDTTKPFKYNKFVISLNNSIIKSFILQNKNQLKYTNTYIQEFLDNNIFFICRRLSEISVKFTHDYEEVMFRNRQSCTCKSGIMFLSFVTAFTWRVMYDDATHWITIKMYFDDSSIPFNYLCERLYISFI